MPGGRLTGRDRERIAAGLAEGLGYAEIARKLERPTSTITREVARNGGPAGYRAADATRDTVRRARRRKPAPAGAGDLTRLPGPDPEAVRAFLELFTSIIVENGVPRMPAKVLACVYVTESGSLTAAELVRHLRVSPASVSKAVAYLEGLGMITRQRDPRTRRERYEIGDDIWLRSWLSSARLAGLWSDAARRGAEMFGVTTVVGERLDYMARFFGRLREYMNGEPEVASGDGRVVAAALLHAGPLTAVRLARALDWPVDRVTRALDAVETSGPVVIRRDAGEVFRAEPRLTEAQVAALDAETVGAGD